MKRIALCLLCILLLCGCSAVKTNENGKIKIVTTLFPEYDLARAVAKDNADITELLPAGQDIHSFEPTLTDIANIKNCDVFIYIGGESDEWVEKILANMKSADFAVIKMCDYVNLVTEDGEEDEYDEHIWTSPENLIKMLYATTDVLSEKYPDKAEEFGINRDEYEKKIRKADDAIKSAVALADKKFIAVGDRFPFKYFTEYYGLSYVAAFGGCEHDTDADILTVAKIINAVKENNLKAVYKIEMSSGAVANTVSEKTGVPVKELHSLHNVTKEDFQKGVTVVDIMYRNAEALR
ncbi:MAG: zinc ABC transporter substrate-binding protein [Clostridiales bacterium]|nr:zinc ABC transporter substrate-binding protein [Candidatus Equinaster intestinalis]